MKRYSLIEQELLDVLFFSMYIIIGVFGLINRNTIISLVTACLALVLILAISIVRLKRTFDVWDETAREHYAIARRITLKIVGCVFSMTIILFLIFRYEFVINAFHLMIIWGSIELLPSIVFIILEKRDV